MAGDIIGGNVKKRAQTTGLGVSIDVNMPSLSSIQRKLGDMSTRAPSVQMNALNQTLTAVNRHLSLGLHERYAYRKKLAKPKYRRAKRDSLYATATYSGGKVNLLDFNYDKGKFGDLRNTPGQKLAAKVLNSSGLKPISRAFVMPAYKNIPKRIARRLTSSGRVGRQLRIEGLYGPTEATMIGKTWDKAGTQEFAQKTLAEKLDEQITKQFLKKWGAKK